MSPDRSSRGGTGGQDLIVIGAGPAGAAASIALRNTLLLIGGAVLLVITSPKLTGLVFLVVPVVLLPILTYGRRVRRLSRASQDRVADLGAYVDETLVSIVDSRTDDARVAVTDIGLEAIEWEWSSGVEGDHVTIARVVVEGDGIVVGTKKGRVLALDIDSGEILWRAEVEGAVRSVGFIAKMSAEAIEDIDPGPVEAIRATGANGFQVLLYAILPQVLPQMLSVIIFEWEINIRRSAILGLVGAGGLGLVFFRQMNTFNFPGVTSVIVAILGIILIGEVVSSFSRKAVI